MRCFYSQSVHTYINQRMCICNIACNNTHSVHAIHVQLLWPAGTASKRATERLRERQRERETDRKCIHINQQWWVSVCMYDCSAATTRVDVVTILIATRRRMTNIIQRQCGTGRKLTVFQPCEQNVYIQNTQRRRWRPPLHANRCARQKYTKAMWPIADAAFTAQRRLMRKTENRESFCERNARV